MDILSHHSVPQVESGKAHTNLIQKMFRDENECVAVKLSRSADLINERLARLLIIDDHCLVSETLSAAIPPSWGLSVETVQSLHDAIDLIDPKAPFELILLDYQLPGVTGFEGLRLLLDRGALRVAIFSGVASTDLIERAIENGACGFVPKSIHLPVLRHALNLMLMGEVYVPASFKIGSAHEASRTNDLKPREKSVLRLICEGRQNKEIASELGLPMSTVAADVKSICRKLGVKNRTQILIEAQRIGLL